LTAEVGQFLVEHFGGRAHQEPREFVHPPRQILDARQECVAVRAILCPGLFDSQGEGLSRVVDDGIAPVDQLAHEW
jgi:hypothetical protein